VTGAICSILTSTSCIGATRQDAGALLQLAPLDQAARVFTTSCGSAGFASQAVNPARAPVLGVLLRWIDQAERRDGVVARPR